MTIVEFFDGVSVVNMASCLSMNPDKIIFIGERKPMRKQENVFRRFVQSRGLEVEFEYRPVMRGNIEQIVSVLSEIAENEEDCIFDLTGGEDLVLVGMGMVFEKYKSTRKIRMHRIDIRTGNFCDCDFDGILPERSKPELSVSENIMLYGGSIVPFNGHKGTVSWDMNDDFENDLLKMWHICKTDPGLWNFQIGMIAFATGLNPELNSSMECSFDVYEFNETMEKRCLKYRWIKGIIDSFVRDGLLLDFEENDGTISFTFKNEQVKMCLTKEGTLLELMVLMYIRHAEEKDGTRRYNDALNGVFIDWDAELHDITDEEKDTENEIDIIAMKGMIPIFISCKNGYVDDNELYKLNTVASKFGGPYARKVLVATYFGKMTARKQQYFAQRAEDMNIELIENVHELTDEAFAKRIKNLRW